MNRALQQLHALAPTVVRKKAAKRLKRMHRYEKNVIDAAYGTIHKTLKRTAHVIAKKLVRHQTVTYEGLPEHLQTCVTPAVFDSLQLLVRTSLRPRKRLSLIPKTEPMSDPRDQAKERSRRVGVYGMQREMAREMDRLNWASSKLGPKACMIKSDRPGEEYRSAAQAAEAMTAIGYRCARQDLYTAMKKGWKCCDRKWERISGIRQHIPRVAKSQQAMPGAAAA